MADLTPDPDRVPDPHRDEPIPRPEEGMRPGVDPAVRPEQDEEVGPVEGLLGTVSADVSDEASEVVGGEDPEAEALLAKMGVEDEDLASGQLLGMFVAVLASFAALAVVVIYLFIIPFKDQTSARAEASASYEALDIVQTEGLAKLGPVASRTDTTFGVPIDQAKGLVVAEYGSSAGAGLPQTRQDWNTLPIMRGMGQAVQQVDRTELEPEFDRPALRRAAERDRGQEVGVESFAPPTVDVIDNDTEPIE